MPRFRRQRDLGEVSDFWAGAATMHLAMRGKDQNWQATDPIKCGLATVAAILASAHTPGARSGHGGPRFQHVDLVETVALTSSRTVRLWPAAVVPAMLTAIGQLPDLLVLPTLAEPPECSTASARILRDRLAECTNIAQAWTVLALAAGFPSVAPAAFLARTRKTHRRATHPEASVGNICTSFRFVCPLPFFCRGAAGLRGLAEAMGASIEQMDELLGIRPGLADFEYAVPWLVEVTLSEVKRRGRIDRSAGNHRRVCNHNTAAI